jgi:transcriptional regulator with XRE-family HTH domain
MDTIAQRIQALRTERGLSRPALAQALGFGKNAVEKFETGRQTPSKEQQARMAEFFGVSVFYLRGESGDRTRQDTWLEGDFADDGPGHIPAPAPVKAKGTPAGQGLSAGGGQGTLLDSFLTSKQFQELLQTTVLSALRSPEGQELLAQAVRKEIIRQK